MAEQVQITLFTFDELPDESKARLIEGFREGYDPAYNHIYDKFINDMSEKYGACIDRDDIEWSGFWSQGDGACFTCEFDEEVIFPILKKRSLMGHQVQYLEELGVDLHAAQSIRCGPSNFYSHENTVIGNIIFNVPGGKEFDDEIANALERDLTEIIRDSCKDLYQRLEDEYERATTTEAIIEEIKNAWSGCNFRKDGTIFAR